MTTPYLLQDLTLEQRLRVLSLDYVITSGLVSPEGWVPTANAIEEYLVTGAVERPAATISQFPVIVDSEV